MRYKEKSILIKGRFYNRVKLDYKINITLGQSKEAVERDFRRLEKVYIKLEALLLKI